MLPLSSIPVTPYFEQLNIGVGRRTLAIGLAVAIAALLLFMLLSWGSEKPPHLEEEFVSVLSLPAAEAPHDARVPSSPRQDRATSPQPAPDQPQQPRPTEALPAQATQPKPASTMPAQVEWRPSPVNPPIGTRAPGGQVYGPPNKGDSSALRDSERVGTAPNGEALYAAAWYREPSDDELRGYLSTASGPGWGLIACRTAPDYRVEDCVGLDEYPNGSQINRAVLAAAWQFKVRPPRVGGKSLVGSWVRIRIDYNRGRR